MQPLLSTAEMRQADRVAIESFSIPEICLMEHAGLAVAQAIQERFQRTLPATSGLIVAGPGNNGGDALVAARILFEKGCRNLFVALLENGRPLSESTALQLAILNKLGIACGRELPLDRLQACDWILDGVLGTGLKRDVDEPVKRALEAINSVSDEKWVVAIDIPSGLSADTGNPCGIAVRASHTITLGFLKKGLFTGEAANYVGHVTLAPIQIPRTAVSKECSTFLYTESDAYCLPRREPASHKGTFGHVAVFAGPEDKQGAAIIGATGALRAGAGLVTVVADPSSLQRLRLRLIPEVMTAALSKEFLTSTSYQAVVLGPGLGLTAEAWDLVQEVLRGAVAVVLDADALTLAAEHAPAAKKLLSERAKHGWVTVLTPHPKEASRLLSSDTAQVQKDRFAACRELVSQWSATVLLKGKGTVIGSAASTVVVDAGDSGLAKGGSGDLLSGLIGSFLAQGMKASSAVPLAAFINGRASQRLSQIYGTERASLATEIADQVPWVLRELETCAIES